MSSPTTPLELVREGWKQLQSQRPVAAWGAWSLALRLDPADSAARQALDRLESSAQLPPIARGPFRFRTPSDAAARARWNDHLDINASDDIDDAAHAFASLISVDPDDAAARYNAALCAAWQGQNLDAIDLLDELIARQVEAGGDRELAIEGWMLAEILRQGSGAEDYADDLSCTLQIIWPAALGDPLERLGENATIESVAMSGTSESGEGHTTEVYEWLLPGFARAEGFAASAIAATLLPHDGGVRLVSPSPPRMRAIEAELLAWLGADLRVADQRATPLPIELMDLAAWRFRMPDDLDHETRLALTRAALDRYYEGEWLDQPRWGLAAAVGDPPLRPSDIENLDGCEAEVARLKLDAILRVREQLLRRPGALRLHGGYHLDGLRRRLNLEPLESE